MYIEFPKRFYDKRIGGFFFKNKNVQMNTPYIYIYIIFYYYYLYVRLHILNIFLNCTMS